MMKKSMVLLIAVGLFFMFGTADAQQETYGFQPGDWEITIEGSGTSDKDFDNSTLSAEAGMGYFFNSMTELGLRQGLGLADIGGGDDNWSASTRLFFDLHFPINCIYPFIGVNFGYLYGDIVDETWIAGPEIGIKGFLSDTAFLFGLVEYNFTFEDADEVDDAFDDGRFVYAVGIGFRM